MATLTSPHATERGDQPALIDEHGTTTWAGLRRAGEPARQRAAGRRAVAPATRSPSSSATAASGSRWPWPRSHGGWTYVPGQLALGRRRAGLRARRRRADCVVVDGRYADAVDAALVDSAADGVRLVVGVDAADRRRPDVPRRRLRGAARRCDPRRAGRPAARRADVLHVGHDRSPEGRARRAARRRRPDARDRRSSWSPRLRRRCSRCRARTLLCGPVYHSAQWAFSFLPLIAGSAGRDAAQVRRRRACSTSSTVTA